MSDHATLGQEITPEEIYCQGIWADVALQAEQEAER
jgi:hypothetical protein